MKTNRRNFISTTALAGGAAILPSCTGDKEESAKKCADYSKLDEVLKQTVLKRDLFTDPVSSIGTVGV